MAQRRSNRLSEARVPNDCGHVLAASGNEPYVRAEFSVDNTIAVRKGWADLLSARDIPDLSAPRQFGFIGHSCNHFGSIGTEGGKVDLAWMHKGKTDSLSGHCIPNLCCVVEGRC